MFGWLAWTTLRPVRRLVCGNLGDTAHALRRYVTEAEHDREVLANNLEALQQESDTIKEARSRLTSLEEESERARLYTESLRKHVANLQDDYDAYKGAMASTLGAVESDVAALQTHLGDIQKDAETLRQHLACIQDDVDAQKRISGDTVAALQKDAETLRKHVGGIQKDIDTHKKLSGDTVAALQKDAKTLRQHLAAFQEDHDATKETMTNQLEALEEFKSRSTLMADNLEKDSSAVVDHVARIQADHDRVATMAAGAQGLAIELRTVFEQLSQMSSDLHNDLTVVAEEVSRLRAHGQDTP